VSSGTFGLPSACRGLGLGILGPCEIFSMIKPKSPQGIEKITVASGNPKVPPAACSEKFSEDTRKISGDTTEAFVA